MIDPATGTTRGDRAWKWTMLALLSLLLILIGIGYVIDRVLCTRRPSNLPRARTRR